VLDLYFLIPLLTLAAAAVCLRRGDWMPWLFVILLTPPFGALLYLIVAFGGLQARSLADRRKSTRASLERARADAQRIDSAGAWEELAAVAFDRRQFAEAAQAAARALAKQPGELEGLFLLGRALVASGRAPEAVRPLAQVVERKPDLANGEALYALAVARRASGDLAGARGELERLAERTSRADFLYELASVQLALGDRAAAVATLRRIVEESVFVPKFVRARVRPWVWRAKWRLLRLGAA
jgi:tetratricopeptide (TPR) repeat protein